MDNFKVDYSHNAKTHHILLPLSLGKSSLALLDMADDLMAGQRMNHRGMTGFILTVLVIDISQVIPMNRDYKVVLQSLKKRYPLHSYVLVNLNEFYSNPQRLKQIYLNNDLSVYSSGSQDELSPSVEQLFLQSRNRTTKEDLLEMITSDLITSYAKENNTDTIIWGDSMTKLAEKVISLASKGRGNSIPSKLIDNPTVPDSQGLCNIRPSREILFSEIVKYSTLQSLDEFIIEPLQPAPTMSKAMSINELAHQYFTSIEEGFPSITSTVVRTANKLTDPSPLYKGKVIEDINICEICKGPIHSNPAVWLNTITVNVHAPAESDQEQTLMSLYKEMSADKDVIERGEYSKRYTCYGCLVTLEGLDKNGILWPIEERGDKDKILSEYILNDESVDQPDDD